MFGKKKLAHKPLDIVVPQEVTPVPEHVQDWEKEDKSKIEKKLDWVERELQEWETRPRPKVLIKKQLGADPQEITDIEVDMYQEEVRHIMHKQVRKHQTPIKKRMQLRAELDEITRELQEVTQQK